MIDRLLSLAGDTVAAAMRAGADAAEAMIVEGFSREVGVREGRIEDIEQAEASEIGIRVFVGKSSAMISGSVLTRDAIDRLIDTTLSVARLAPPDPFAGIADPGYLATSFPDLDMVSATLPDATALETMAREAEAAALGVAGVSKSGGAGASASDRKIVLVTSNGFAHGYRKTGVGMSVSAIAGEGTAMERDYDYCSAVHYGDLKSPQAVGLEAGRRAARRLNPRKLKSQQVPVIFDRRVASSLIGHLLGAINGASIARGTSFLKDRLGQKIFSDAITIVEDPFIRRGHASRPFDGEGLAGAKRNLIDQGVLTTWLLDLRSSRQLGLKPTGQASRGLNTPPSPSSSNLYLKAGNCSPEELLSHVRHGLFVTELIGSSVNMVTGDYSRGASGFWIENGELAYPVSEITIAGNLKDMFPAITPCNDLEFRTAVNAPTCRVEGLTIAGT
jgi:PmbA protein